jgi:hypothetical protein
MRLIAVISQNSINYAKYLKFSPNILNPPALVDTRLFWLCWAEAYDKAVTAEHQGGGGEASQCCGLQGHQERTK